MNIGQRIKERRKELRMSADELGARLGKDRSTIYRYENGDIEKLPLEILKPIAVALLTTPQDLMGWEEDEKKGQSAEAELSENKSKLIDFVLKVPEDKVELVLRVMKSIVEDD